MSRTRPLPQMVVRPLDSGRGRAFRIVNMPTRKASNWVRAVLATPDGSVYFGTEGGGLHRLRNGVFTSWDRSRGLPGDNVRALGLSGGEVIERWLALR